MTTGLIFNLLIVMCPLLQAEWEALEICGHKWALENVEDELIERSPTPIVPYGQHNFLTKMKVK